MVTSSTADSNLEMLAPSQFTLYLSLHLKVWNVFHKYSVPAKAKKYYGFTIVLR